MKAFLKKFGIAIAAALGILLALAATLLGKKRPDGTLPPPPPPPPPPPAPPDLDDISIPVVEENPSDTYEAGKAAPATDPSAVVVNINERHK